MRTAGHDRRTVPPPFWGHDGRWRSTALLLTLIAGWAVTLWFSLTSPLWMPNSWALGLALLVTWKRGPWHGIAVRFACEAARWSLLPNDLWTASAGWQAVAALLAAILLIVWVDRRHAAWQREHDLARLDPLTQLPNRQALEERLAAELNRAGRFHRPLSLFLLDCDGFKQLNDQRGHAAGDEALRKVAETLQSSIRQYDTIARMGGDEFVLILPETDLPDAESVAERVQAAFGHSVGKAFPGLTASLGVVVFRSPPPAAEECLRFADAAMYRAKHAGKNRTEFEVWEGTSSGTPPVSVKASGS